MSDSMMAVNANLRPRVISGAGGSIILFYRVRRRPRCQPESAALSARARPGRWPDHRGDGRALSPLGRALPGPADVIHGHAVAGDACGTGQGLRQPMPGALRGIEQDGLVEAARHLIDERPRAVGRLVVGPEAERSAPLLFPPRGEIDAQVNPPFETELRVDGIVEMNVELASASVRVPAAAVQPGIGK